MKKLWKSIGDIGIAAGMRPELRSKVKLTNELSACLAFIAHFYIYIFTVLGYRKEGLGVILIVAGIAAPMLLNKFRLYVFSRVWLLITFNVILFIYSVKFGETAGIQFVYFVSGFIALVIFDIEDRLYTISGAGLSLLCSYLFYAANRGVPTLSISPEKQHIILYTVILNNFLMLALFVRFWSRQMTRAKGEIADTYRNFFENLPASMFIVGNSDGSFLAVNNEAAIVYGYSKEQLMKKSYSGIAPGFDIAQAAAGIRDLGTQVHQKKDGTHFFVHVLTNSTSYLEAEATLVLVLDINEKVIAERQNEQLRLSLQQAQVESKYKSQFLANVSHEFRTPLNNIIVIGRLLSENKDKNLNGRQMEYADIAYSSGRELQAFVDLILEFARRETIQIHLKYESALVEELMSRIRRQFSVQADEKEIRFEIIVDDSAPATLRTDVLHFETLVKNLLSNAIKFTGRGGTVSLHLSAFAGSLTIAVTDNGIGIPEDRHKIIFEPFEQADASVMKEFGGAGLGLSICREIVKRMNGKIDVMSIPGRGSTFRISLPLMPEEEDVLIDNTTSSVSIAILE